MIKRVGKRFSQTDPEKSTCYWVTWKSQDDLRLLDQWNLHFRCIRSEICKKKPLIPDILSFSRLTFQRWKLQNWHLLIAGSKKERLPGVCCGVSAFPLICKCCELRDRNVDFSKLGVHGSIVNSLCGCKSRSSQIFRTFWALRSVSIGMRSTNSSI